MATSSVPISEDLRNPSGERLTVPAFELEDQEGRLHAYAGRSDLLVVMLVASQEGADSNTQWDHWLSKQFGDRIEIYRVLELSGVPKLFASIVRSRLREGVDPPGIPILMDWEGRFASLLPLSEHASTVMVVDGDGKVALVVRGTPNEALKQRVIVELDRLGTEPYGD